MFLNKKHHKNQPNSQNQLYIMVRTYSCKLMYFSPFQLYYGSTTLKIVVFFIKIFW